MKKNSSKKNTIFVKDRFADKLGLVKLDGIKKKKFIYHNIIVSYLFLAILKIENITDVQQMIKNKYTMLNNCMKFSLV